MATTAQQHALSKKLFVRTPPSTTIETAALELDGAVFLSWRGVGADSYTLQRRYKGDSAWTNVGTTRETRYTVTGVPNGSAIEYRVVAGGNLGQSPVVAATAEVDRLATIFFPAPAEFRGYCVGGDRIFLTWRKGDRTERLTYEIEYSTSGGAAWLPLAMLAPPACNRGIYTDSDPVEWRQKEALRHFEHKLDGAYTSVQYRIRTRYQEGIMVSAWTQISVNATGRYVDCTPETFAVVYASQPAHSGRCVRISQGVLATDQDITLIPGVSIIVSKPEQTRVNYTGKQIYSWEKAFLRVKNQNVTDMNILIDGLYIDCQDYQGRAGMSLINVRSVWVRNCIVRRSAWQGVGFGENTEDCVIATNTYHDAGYAPLEARATDTWDDEGHSFIGATVVRGDSVNVQYVENTTEAEEHERGYGLKLTIDFIRKDAQGKNYNCHRDFIAYNNTYRMGGRFWLGQSTQFAVEVWAAESERNVWQNEFAKGGLSFEHRNTVNPGVDFTVHFVLSYIAPPHKGLESSPQKILYSSNVVDLRNTTDVQEVWGDYNRPKNAQGVDQGLYTSDDLVIERNLILCGNNNPNVLTERNIRRNSRIRHNTYVTSAAAPYAFVNYRSYDNGETPNDPAGVEVANNVLICAASDNFYWLKKSTDAAGGGFLPFGTGQATVGLGCTVIGNTVNATLSPYGLPATAIKAANAYNTQAELAGNSPDIRLAYRPAVSGNLTNNGNQVGKKFNGTAPDRGAYEL